MWDNMLTEKYDRAYAALRRVEYDISLEEWLWILARLWWRKFTTLARLRWLRWRYK